MMHLTDEELYNIAEVTEETKPYNDEELEQMEHLKECSECYDKFCAALMLAETTSESGYIYLSKSYTTNSEILNSNFFEKKVYAVLKIVRNVAEDAASNIMEQIYKFSSIIQFARPMEFAVRSGLENKNKILKLEDKQDDKTFVLFEPEKNQLMIQIALSDNKRNFEVYIEFDNKEKIIVPLEYTNGIAKGTICNIPTGNFKIYIR